MIDVQRWWYRRMAWKNDQSLFMNMHPRVAWLVDRLYEPSWPIREWFYDMSQAACRKQKRQAIRDVYGYRDTEINVRDFDGTATEIYREARREGWTGKKNSVHPYTRRELMEMRLHHYFKFSEAELATMNDTELFDLLNQQNDRDRERKAQAKA